jgi:penicillin-binding protein 1A
MAIHMNYGKDGVRKQERTLRKGSGRWGKKFGIVLFKIILIAFLALVIIGISAGIGVFRGIIASAPDISNISVTPTGFSTFVYDTEGNQTAKLVSTDSNRIPVTMDMIPENMAHAFVAIEDERFYEHHGIDIQGIIRAAYIGVTTGNFSEGASTITQQLLKNNVFTGWTSENSFVAKMKRKIQEQYLAVQLEKTMSKDDILLNYMNSINLGQNTLGVQAASLRYFNKSVSDLSLSECAVIAGITQNPSKYNPITHPDANAKRREKVLGNMLDQGYITQTEYDEAMNDDVYSRIQTADQESTENTVNSYFVDALTTEVLDDLIDAGYNETQAYTLLYSGGLKIYSTQDPKIQGIADSVFQNEDNYPAGTKYLLSYALTTKSASGDMTNYSSEMMSDYFKKKKASFNMLFDSSDAAQAAIDEYKASVLGDGDEVYDETISLTPQPQVSMTIEDQSTGYVVALEGGRGAKDASRTLNRATDTVRQPGSTFKIVSTYAPALDSGGLTLATVLNDAPFSYSNGRPVRNWYGEAYRGLTTLRTGIMNSMNIIAVKTLTLITPQLGFDYLKNFGFTTLVDNEEIKGKIYSDITQTLALGGITKGVKNIELNAAYAAIANGGTYIKPKLYTKVVDHDGNVILDNTKPQTKQVIKATTAYLLTSAMEDVVKKGTGKICNFGGTAIAGKTGTTSDENDVWFSGYTTYYTATTWAGFDNNVDLKTTAQQQLAKTLWRKTMEQIHKGLPSTNFPVPAGIVTATVCSKSGKLPIPGLCDGSLEQEYFAEGTVPTESCDVHYSGALCQYSGLPATDLCPFKVQGVFELTPPEPAALQSGSGSKGNATVSTTTDAAGNKVNVTQHCPHDAAFFAQPNAQAIIQQELLEIQQRNAAAGITTPTADPATVAASAAAAAAAAGISTPATVPVPTPNTAATASSAANAAAGTAASVTP